MLSTAQPIDRPDPLAWAMYGTVHEFRHRHRRGASALGPRVGIHAGTLANKVNPTFPSQALSVHEAVAVMEATGDYRILQQICVALNHVAHPLPDFARCSDAALLDLWASYISTCGDHATTVRKALCDGVVTRAELSAVRDAMQCVMAAGLEFIGRMEGLVRDAPAEGLHAH